MSQLRQLREQGQLVWIDRPRAPERRRAVLRRLVDDRGVSGVLGLGAASPDAVDDLRETADALREVYHLTDGFGGHVGADLPAGLAHDSLATINAARELWQRVDRPNLLIKLPATTAGLPALRQLIGEGINVAATPIFGLQRYREVAEAYQAGIEDRIRAGGPLRHEMSVAGLALRAIDQAADVRLESFAARDDETGRLARGARGRVATAVAKCAYHLFHDTVDAAAFRRLAERGANPQRLLWLNGPLGVPGEDDDAPYLEALIGPDTIACASPAALASFDTHGDATPRLGRDHAAAVALLRDLDRLGLDLNALALELELALFPVPGTAPGAIA